MRSCQSGVWKKASGAEGGTGLSGVFAPLKGMQISCAALGSTLYGMVDANGVPYIRCAYGATDTGWRPNISKIYCNATGTYAGQVTTTGIFINDGSICQAQWPTN